MRNLLAILDITQNLIWIPHKTSYLKVTNFLQKLGSEIIGQKINFTDQT